MINCAFNKGENECSALKFKACEGCSFYKTKEALFDGREKANRRIDRLDVELRRYIYNKYYAGQRPKLNQR